MLEKTYMAGGGLWDLCNALKRSRSLTLEKIVKDDRLAAEVVRLAQNKLLVRYRFLDRALFKMPPRVHESVCGTDGRAWYYIPERLLNRFSTNRDAGVHLLLHSLLHNIFRHFFANVAEPNLWDIACDMMVEKIISDLQVCPVSSERIAALGLEQKEIVPFTAEKIYARLMREDLGEERLAALAALFYEDDHLLWYRGRQSASRKNRIEEANNARTESDDTPQCAAQKAKEDRAKQATVRGKERPRNVLSAGRSDGKEGKVADDMLRMAQGWQEIAQRMQVELEHFARGGQGSSDLSVQLAFANRERQDYSVFLKKFAAALREQMRVDLDTFDYNYYSYGLHLYGNMPLIEPLEYREVKVIRSFAVILDTSGSVDRSLLEKFLQKTYDCLLSEESFTKRVAVHIVQADDRVQSDVCIHSSQELQEYLRELTVHGRGGTDFRPALEYVEKLQKDGSLINLKGVLYFTDGKGVFPDRKPPFETAFIYVGEGAFRAKVPAWALKVVFSEDDDGVTIV